MKRKLTLLSEVNSKRWRLVDRDSAPFSWFASDMLGCTPHALRQGTQSAPGGVESTSAKNAYMATLRVELPAHWKLDAERKSVPPPPLKQC